MTRSISTRPRRTGALDAIVIGAGHSGLAASRLLGERGLRHVVLERGEVANAWRERRWSSLRLLTPNRHTRLPGFTYAGADPDGFMRATELVELLETYAADAPVVTQAEVTGLCRDGDAWRVDSKAGVWRARAVVVASGACAKASVPAISRQVPADVMQLTPLSYRSPRDLEPGGVLVVGASATGVQFADELARAGRDVTLAVGEHVRMPRRYRGRDIFDWLTRTGISDERYDAIDDLERGRNLPSPQLAGDNSRPILDLNGLTDAGVRIVGRLVGVRDGVAQFSGSLRNVCALADLKMQRLLTSIDQFIDASFDDDGEGLADERSGRPAPPAAPERFEDTRVPAKPLLTLELRQSVRTIVWATGFRPDHAWLDAPVFDRKGRLQHDGGVVAAPGLYVLGLPLMRRRKSSFIFGAGDDARDITAHLAGYLAGDRAAPAERPRPGDSTVHSVRRRA